MEGTSKAQIITPRSITPTNESSNKKKKQDNSAQNEAKKVANVSSSNLASSQISSKQSKESKIPKELTPPPPKQISQIAKKGALFFENLKHRNSIKLSFEKGIRRIFFQNI